MVKNGLFVMSLGLIGILFSAMGAGMRINYLQLLTGIVVVAIGGFIFYKGKQKEEKNGGEK